MKDAAGTTPPGTSSESQAARWVQGTFAEIAPRYDLLNHLLSFNIDRGWRRALLRQLDEQLRRPDAKVLDLCCGTGDVLIDLQAAAACRVMGADFCHPMLLAAQRKAQRHEFAAPLAEADALQLPFAADSLNAIAISFGFRNLTNYRAGLRELLRVLKPDGVLAILEFSHPPHFMMRTAYGFYSRAILPVLGSLISGSREAYSYLPDSIKRFPKAEALKIMMAEAGFAKTSYELLTGGVAALHVGRKLAGCESTAGTGRA